MFSYQCSFLLLPFHATAFILYQSVSCLSTTFFISFLLLRRSPSRDSFNRIAYSSRLVNSFFIFHPLCLCMPLLSLCLDQRTIWYLTTPFLNCQCCFYILRNSEYSDISSAIRIVRRISCSHEKTADYTDEMSATL